MAINVAEKKVLNILLRSRGELDSFTLFKQSRMGFALFMKTVDGLANKETIIKDGFRILLSQKGIGMILASTRTSVGTEFRSVPQHFGQHSIEVSEPYVPNVRYLDEETFNLRSFELD